jgi:hypothetical protein
VSRVTEAAFSANPDWHEIVLPSSKVQLNILQSDANISSEAERRTADAAVPFVAWPRHG